MRNKQKKLQKNYKKTTKKLQKKLQKNYKKITKKLQKMPLLFSHPE